MDAHCKANFSSQFGHFCDTMFGRSGLRVGADVYCWFNWICLHMRNNRWQSPVSQSSYCWGINNNEFQHRRTASSSTFGVLPITSRTRSLVVRHPQHVSLFNKRTRLLALTSASHGLWADFIYVTLFFFPPYFSIAFFSYIFKNSFERQREERERGERWGPRKGVKMNFHSFTDSLHKYPCVTRLRPRT